MDTRMAHLDEGGGWHARFGYVTLAYRDCGGRMAHPLVEAACGDLVRAAIEEGEWRALYDRLCELGVECSWDSDDGYDGNYIVGRLVRRGDSVDEATIEEDRAQQREQRRIARERAAEEADDADRS